MQKLTKQEIKNGIIRFFIVLALTIAVLMIVPPPTFAATQGSITQDSIAAAAISANDVDSSGIGMLRKAFGNIVDNPLSPSSTNAGETALGRIFGVINMSLLALGSIFLMYNVTVGIAQTAQDGEFLGKRFSSLWIPVRLLTGTTALVPVFKGFCAAQLVILAVAQMGVGIANMATTEIAKFVDAGGTVVSVPATAVNQKFVTELYKIHLCESGINIGTGDPKTITESISNGQMTYGRGKGDSLCGVVQMPGNASIIGVESTSGAQAQMAAINAFQSINKLVGSHTDLLITDLKADYLVKNGNPIFPHLARDADIEGYTKTYQDTLRSNLRNTLQTNTHLTTDLSKTGFIGLGTVYTQLSGASDAANEAMQQQASVIKPAPGSQAVDAMVGELYKAALLAVAGHQAQTLSSLQAMNLPPDDESFIIREFIQRSTGALPVPETCNGNSPKLGFTNAGTALLAVVINATGCNPDALSRMKNVGDYLSVIGWVGVGIAADVKGAARGAQKALGSIPLVGGLISGIASIAGSTIETFDDIFLTMMEIITLFASMLSTYLPLIPYIAWLGAIISWLTVVVEGVVGAPLWAFAHLDTDGEGMGQRAQHGYQFLFQVLFRPVLMVVGFVMSIILMNIVGKFFFMTFVTAVSNANADSFTGLVAFMILVGVFFTTSVMIITTCVNLIHIVPDTVLNWISNTTGSAGAGSKMDGNFANGSSMVTGAGATIARNAVGARKGKISGMMDKLDMMKSRHARTTGNGVSGGNGASAKSR